MVTCKGGGEGGGDGHMSSRGDEDGRMQGRGYEDGNMQGRGGVGERGVDVQRPFPIGSDNINSGKSYPCCLISKSTPRSPPHKTTVDPRLQRTYGLPRDD